MPPTSRPDRQASKLDHDPPDWIPDHATYFITINCLKRGLPQLTINDIPAKLFSSVSYYHDHAKWFPEIVLLMPDHLHALITFSWEPGLGMKKTLENWKHYAATTCGIDWQRGFFDQRIRSEVDHAEKWAYIRDNPLRANLVETYSDWPHVWFPNRTGW